MNHLDTVPNNRILIIDDNPSIHEDIRKILGKVAAGFVPTLALQAKLALVEGRQDYVPVRPAVYGQSITDACLSISQTEPLLEQFAEAQRARG